ncbi:MAG: PAS domain-containing protein, partial [Deltaproteobacteria bacterium]|nr:PAS domain-containing protein [Deltaproteobacteria bacterium]
AKELVRLSRHPYLAASSSKQTRPPTFDVKPDGSKEKIQGLPIGDGSSSDPKGGTVLAKIMAIVRTVVGVDFTEYKTPTFARRLARRMALRRVEGQDNYLALLGRDADEVRNLCEDTLIHVSSFFRDPQVFQALRISVFPEIVKHKAEGAPIRIWVAGCSTGEEVYSLAICLLEFLGDSSHPYPIQLFGTDVSDRAIGTARAGKYADGAMRGLSDQQRARHFTKLDVGFRINKSVRDLCVFVRHDLARDPPFSKLDMLSCRNVLIYFDQKLQKRVLPTFHYALNQPGFLLLGRTEHISGFVQLFSPVDQASKIFARSATRSDLRFAPRSEMPPAATLATAVRTNEFPRRAGDIGRHLDSLLLARYAPPGVLVNEKLDVLQFRGQTGSYLQHAPGEPQNNIVKMARGGLRAKLQETLARAKKEMAPVRTEGVEVDQDGFTRICDIVALPFSGLPDVKEQLFVLLFEEIPAAGAKSPRKAGRKSRRDSGKVKGGLANTAPNEKRIPELEHELSSTTEYLHSLIQEHSRTNEDLGSANEELVSGNEELQSLNEELETAKEELQSTNEELTTVNDELHHRNLEVGLINSDLVNLLDTVDIPIVILDKRRHIRRFTPKASDVLNVTSGDVGRLFDEIKPNIDVPDLDGQIAEVIATFAARESEVQDRDGRWYRMQIRPYKTPDDRIDGAVLSLFDIDALKHHVREAQQAKGRAESADHAKDDFLAVLSHELRTPLSALLMQTQLLRQVGADPAKRDRACDAIERSTKMQVQLINDLLDVSRIVTGKMRVDLQPVDLAAIVKTTLDNVAALAESKSIEMRGFLDRSMGPVSGDRIRLEQVISNLVVNALKFTPKGGRVDVVLENAEGMAHLKVSDTGMGIEPDFLPRIFHRLTQKDSSSTRPYAGLGLGLAIVRHLVGAHGGTVTAESPGSGKGATFHVRLPLLPEMPETRGDLDSAVQSTTDAPPTGEAAAGVLSGKRILVVEDDVDIREALDEMLTQTGATVMTAGSAAAAISMFRHFHPHALLCDIAMPVEDGYAFIRRVRALGPDEGGGTPALALTALAGETHRQRALAAGFQMQLTKPVDIDALAAAVTELLGGVRPFSAMERRPDNTTTP